MHWYRKAVAAGDAQAKQRLAFLLNWLGDQAKCDNQPEKAETWYTEARQVDPANVDNAAKHITCTDR